MSDGIKISFFTPLHSISASCTFASSVPAGAVTACWYGSKKSTPFAAQAAVEDAMAKAMEHGI